MSTEHSDYALFGGRIAFSNLQKKTSNSFVQTVKRLRNYLHPIRGTPFPLVSDILLETAMKYADRIEKEIRYERDLEFNYFAYRSLTRSYLLYEYNPITKVKITVERPQHFWMRVALGIHGDDIESAIRAYHNMSQKYYTHATPTLCQSGTPNNQLSRYYFFPPFVPF